MSNKKRIELIDKLRKTKQPFKVGIVDDLGEEISTHIKDNIDCYVTTLTLDFLNRCIDKKSLDSLSKYDAIFFDATYEEDGIDSVGILEELIKIRPEFKEICKMFIGTDIKEYGRFSDNDKVKMLIARVKELPNVLYGGNKGTKTENMIKCIQKEGIRKGIEVPNKYPKGICRPELLEIIKPYLDRINKNLEEQETISISLENATQGFEPINEDERRIIERVGEISDLLLLNQHTIRQVHIGLSSACRNVERNLHTENNDNEIEVK